jgi:hypothetical protein
MNIAADGTRVNAARAFLRPALSRPNLTLLLNTKVVKLNFKGQTRRSALGRPPLERCSFLISIYPDADAPPDALGWSDSAGSAMGKVTSCAWHVPVPPRIAALPCLRGVTHLHASLAA